MLTFFLSTLFIIIFFISTCGWGRVIAQLACGRSYQQWAFMSALGLASLIFLGGMLNFIGIAYSAILSAIFFAGIIFGFFELFQSSFSYSSIFRDMQSKTKFDKYCYILSMALICVTFVFLVATLMPTNAFNIYDDFHTYLMRPFRMLQTGTMGGNNFDILGIDSLGGQSFLQAFFLAILPIQYVNGFDTIFCFILLMFLLVEIAQKIKAHGLYLLFSILLLILINPQIVNLSALYSGSVMILGIIIAGIILEDSYNVETGKLTLVKIIPFALFISALISLKSTLALFAVIYFVIYFLVSLMFLKEKKAIVMTGWGSALFVMLFLFPWLAVHSKNYYSFIKTLLHNNQEIFFKSYHFYQNPIMKDWFSSERLYWGGSFFGYNFLILMIMMASLLSACCLINKKYIAKKAYLTSIFVGGVVCIINYFLIAYFWDPYTNIRYSCSTIIAVFPFAFLFLGSQYGIFSPIYISIRHKTIISQYGMSLTTLLVLILIAGYFGDSLLKRINLAYHNKVSIEFPFPPGYIGFNRSVLNNDTRNAVLEIQNMTEKDHKILAWISIPFYLNFTRNKIVTVSEPGLSNKWLDLPINGESGNLRKYLSQMGIRYIIWQYQGGAIKKDSVFKNYLKSPYPIYRKIGLYNLYFREVLFELAKENLIIYNQDGIMIIDIR